MGSELNLAFDDILKNRTKPEKAVPENDLFSEFDNILAEKDANSTIPVSKEYPISQPDDSFSVGMPVSEQQDLGFEKQKDIKANDSLSKSNAEYQQNNDIITNSISGFEPVEIKGSNIKDPTLIDKAKYAYQSAKAIKPLSDEFLGSGLKPLVDAPKGSKEYKDAIEKENKIGASIVGDTPINKIEASGGIPSDAALNKIMKNYSKYNDVGENDKNYLRNYLSRQMSTSREEGRDIAKEKAKTIITPEQQDYALFDNVNKTLESLENVDNSNSPKLIKALKEGWKTAKIRGQIESEIAKTSELNPERAKELSDLAKGLDGELEQLNPDRGKVLNFLRQTSEILQPMASTIGEGTIIGLIPGGQLIAPLYTYDKWRKMTAGQMFKEMVDNGIDPQTASINASNLSMVHALVESLEAGTIGKSGLKAIAKKSFLKKALSKNKGKVADTAKRLLKNSKSFVKDVAEQSIQEGVQAGMETSAPGKEFGGAGAVVKGAIESIPQMIMTVGITGLLGKGARGLVNAKAPKQINQITEWLTENGVESENAVKMAKELVAEVQVGKIKEKTKKFFENIKNKIPKKEETIVESESNKPLNETIVDEQTDNALQEDNISQEEPVQKPDEAIEPIENIDIDKEDIDVDVENIKDIPTIESEYDPEEDWVKEDEKSKTSTSTKVKDEAVQEKIKDDIKEEVGKKVEDNAGQVKHPVMQEMEDTINHTKEKARFTKFVKPQIPTTSKMYKQLIAPKKGKGEVLTASQDKILAEYAKDYEKRTGIKKHYSDIIREFTQKGLPNLKAISKYKKGMLDKIAQKKPIKKVIPKTKDSVIDKALEDFKIFNEVDFYNDHELDQREKQLLAINTDSPEYKKEIKQRLAEIKEARVENKKLQESSLNPYIDILNDIKGDPVGLIESRKEGLLAEKERLIEARKRLKGFTSWISGRDGVLKKGTIQPGSLEFKVLKGESAKDAKGNRVTLGKAQKANLDKYAEEVNRDYGTDYNGWDDLVKELFDDGGNLEINKAELQKIRDELSVIDKERESIIDELNYYNNQAMLWDEKYGSKNYNSNTDFEESDYFQKKPGKNKEDLKPVKKKYKIKSDKEYRKPAVKKAIPKKQTNKNKPQVKSKKLDTSKQVHIVVSNELEYNGRKYKLPDTADGAIYNYDNYSVIQIREGLTQDELVKTIKHELMGHRRLSNLLAVDKRLDKQLRTLFEKADVTGLEKNYKEQLKGLTPKNREELLYNEWLAFAVQNHKTNLLKKAWSLIKRFFAKLGLRENNIKELLDQIDTKTNVKEVTKITEKVKDKGSVYVAKDKYTVPKAKKWLVQYLKTAEEESEDAKKLRRVLKRIDFYKKSKLQKEKNISGLAKSINTYMRDLAELGQEITPYQRQKVINYILHYAPSTEKGFEKFKQRLLDRVDTIAMKNYHKKKLEAFRKALVKIRNAKDVRPEAQEKIRSLIGKYRLHTLSPAKRQEYINNIYAKIVPHDSKLTLEEMQQEVDKISLEDLTEVELESLQDELQKTIEEEGLSKLLFGEKKMKEYNDNLSQAIANIKKTAKKGFKNSSNAFNENLDVSTATKTNVLDYYWGTGKLRPEIITEILDGVEPNSKEAVLTKLLFKEFVKGRDEYLAFKQGAKDRLKEVAKWNDIKNLTTASVAGESVKKKREFFFQNAISVPFEKKTIKMMPDDIIAFYMHSKNEHNRKALLQEVEEIEDKYGQKTFRGGVVFDDNFTMKPIHITEDDLKTISDIVENNKLYSKIVKHLQYEMGTVNNKAIHKASSEINFIPIKMVDNYFPLHRTNLHKNIILDGLKLTDMGSYTKSYVEQSGNLKERNTNARGTVVLRGALRELVETTNLAASYPAFAERTRVARQLLGDIKNEMINAGRGKEYKRLFDLTKEIQGDVEGFADEHNTITRNIFGNLVKSALGNTPSVILRQVGSYPLILTEMDMKDVAKGLALMPNSSEAKELDKNIKNYSPSIRSRLTGSYANIELGQKAYSAAVKEFLGAPDHWSDKQMAGITIADRMTILRVVNAVKAEIERTTDLRGGKLWERIAERSNEVIGRTQPMYSTEHRSAVARSKNPAVKMMTAFTSVTNAILNQAIRVITRYKRTGNKPEFIKSLASIIFASGFLMSMIDILIDKFKNRETSTKRFFIGTAKYLLGVQYGAAAASGAIADIANSFNFNDGELHFDANNLKKMRETTRGFNNIIGSTGENFTRSFQELFNTKRYIEDKDLEKIFNMVVNFVDIPLSLRGVAFRNAVRNSQHFIKHFTNGGETIETDIDLGNYTPEYSQFTTINNKRYRVDKPTQRKLYREMFETANELYKQNKYKDMAPKKLFRIARKVVKSKNMQKGGLLSTEALKNNATIVE